MYTSEESENRGKAFKNFCRIFIEMIFTQVIVPLPDHTDNYIFVQIGVGCLVVCYTIVGAFAFQSLETMNTDDLIKEVTERRFRAVTKLWNITNTFNTLNTRLGGS